MSSNTAQIPQSARIVRRAAAVVPIGPNAGKTYTAELYSGRASHGYQTDYTATDHRWLVIRVAGRVWGCWQYSGARLARAERDYLANVAELRRAGAQIAEV